MKPTINTISLEDAKAVDIVSYLAFLGHEPSRIRNNDYWYHSPLREERTASFKVNRHLNLWYDHGSGKGGTIIDLGMQYNQCTLPEFLEKLSSGGPSLKPALQPSANIVSGDSDLKINREIPLQSPALLHYLQQRKIPLKVAYEFCSEVHYSLHGKCYYGIGFKNDSGGFEIRNAYFKASSSPKEITTFDQGSDQVHAFEGFMDFLSFKTIYQNLPVMQENFVILNSASLFEKARAFMERHNAIGLYFDRDKTGIRLTQKALSISNTYRDESAHYHGYKDLNEMAVKCKQSSKIPFRRKMG